MTDDLLRRADEWGPEKVVVVADRRSGMRGVLVIDNTARGPGKGGTRMSPTLTVDEVMRLARTMTWKWAAVDLFQGGAKAGILGDPDGPGKERILRAFARALSDHVPAEYVFGLDMGLNEADAAVFVDELRDRGVSTGLPRSLGGLPYDQLGVTGHGVAESADAAASELGLEMSGLRVAIQGFGAVGRATARRLDEMGATVVAVSTAAGAVVQPDGIDVPLLLAAAEAEGDDCVRASSARPLAPREALLTDADVLVPAAMEDAIDADTAGRLRARLVVEGANLPTTDAARAILHERGVPVVPDFIANAGGIVAAAHSLDQRYSPFVVREEEVLSMVAARLRTNTRAVLTAARTDGVPPRAAALRIAEGRVRAAMRVRGER